MRGEGEEEEGGRGWRTARGGGGTEGEGHWREERKEGGWREEGGE